MFMFICFCVYVNVYMLMFICLCLYVYVYMFINLYVYVFKLMFMFICLYVYVVLFMKYDDNIFMHENNFEYSDLAFIMMLYTFK